MAIHRTHNSMKLESLRELLEVAKYCIHFDKTGTWGYPGCYGYPATILLLSAVDAIGAHVKGGGDDMKKHFEILNDPEWFNMQLSEEQIKLLMKLRNKLVHQSWFERHFVLAPCNSERVIITRDGKLYVYLIPFYRITEKMFKKLSGALKDERCSLTGEPLTGDISI